MRLDRLDGSGGVASAEEDCLEATCIGFQDGLSIQEQEGCLPQGFRKTFLNELSRFSEEELAERFYSLLASYAARRAGFAGNQKKYCLTYKTGPSGQSEFGKIILQQFSVFLLTKDEYIFYSFILSFFHFLF